MAMGSIKSFSTRPLPVDPRFFIMFSEVDSTSSTIEVAII